MYSTKKWLNPPDSPLLGSISTFDGNIVYDNKEVRSTFLAISDCYAFVKLHKTDDMTMNDFITKLKILNCELCNFIEYLKTVKDD